MRITQTTRIPELNLVYIHNMSVPQWCPAIHMKHFCFKLYGQSLTNIMQYAQHMSSQCLTSTDEPSTCCLST